MPIADLKPRACQDLRAEPSRGVLAGGAKLVNHRAATVFVLADAKKGSPTVPVYVSSYLACIAYLLFVISPLFIPIGVTIVGAISGRRATRREQAAAKAPADSSCADQPHQTEKRSTAASMHTQARDESTSNDRSTSTHDSEPRPSGVAHTRV